MTEVSRRVRAAEASFAPIADFYFRSRYAERRFEKGVADFTFGNPQEMPLDGFVSAMREAAIPQDKNWFAYKTSEAEPCEFLAELLDRASTRIGRCIFLLSDEPYRRLRFDGRSFTSPATIYPWTLISYSYGKILLSPGQRLGYLALSPLMPRETRKAIREVTFSAQMALGWTFPSALMQHAVPALESLSIDQAALARRRDQLIPALAEAGYRPLDPEGTFYLFSRWPEGDPEAFWNRLADRDVFVLPGSILAAPDYFRISLTASDAMVEKALPAFAEASAASQAGR